tara:strand:+ start:400 stop:702 length:303 start_codon:yes stop_codon:yes gene_type:complete
MEIKKGKMVLITSGEYDEYGVDSVTTAKKDFNLNEVHKKWSEDSLEPFGFYRNVLKVKEGHKSFCNHLIDEGFVFDNDYIEVGVEKEDSHELCITIYGEG